MIKNILKTLFLGWIAKRFARRGARNTTPHRY